MRFCWQRGCIPFSNTCCYGVCCVVSASPVQILFHLLMVSVVFIQHRPRPPHRAIRHRALERERARVATASNSMYLHILSLPVRARVYFLTVCRWWTHYNKKLPMRNLCSQIRIAKNKTIRIRICDLFRTKSWPSYGGYIDIWTNILKLLFPYHTWIGHSA